MEKQFGKRLGCAAVLGMCLLSVVNAADSTGELTPQGAKAYLEVIQSEQSKYGVAAKSVTGMWEGLAFTRLIDFDGDGIPELYCGGSNPEQYMKQQALYTYADGKVQDLNIPQRASNFGTDVSPCVQFYVDAGKAYLVDGQEVMNGGAVTYYTKSGNAMTVTLVYTDEYEKDATLNGQVVTRDALKEQTDAFTAGMTEQYYSYWSGMENSVPEGSVAETIAALRQLTNPTANPSNHKVSIDGSEVALSAYTIHGNNYFKLRDVAAVLSGTQKQVEISWNSASQRIDITANLPYTTVGGEQATLAMGSRGASLTQATVYYGGEKLELTAYVIDGNNYFKLRDLGEALDFGVAWDESTQTILVDTSVAYAE